MALTDYVEIELSAGDGGDGVVRWRREKYIPKGGPAGGDGGNGGSVYVKGIKDNAKLQFYVGKNRLSGENGKDGGSKSLYGENGKDLIVEVPVGTVVTNLDTGGSVDVTNEDLILLLQGGRGGLGNIHFKSATNQTPKQQTDGKLGESARFSFELQLIADAGFIGLPSVGKSTLLNSLTNAKSKTAEYHFTTTEPHLGRLEEFILADIPGLIEGAAAGKGLGHKFLRHIKRTDLLLHCLSLESVDIKSDYQAIRKELDDYDSDLSKKTEQIIFTKSDMVDQKKMTKLKEGFPTAWFVTVLDDQSVKVIKDNLVKLLRSGKI